MSINCYHKKTWRWYIHISITGFLFSIVLSQNIHYIAGLFCSMFTFAYLMSYTTYDHIGWCRANGIVSELENPKMWR